MVKLHRLSFLCSYKGSISRSVFELSHASTNRRGWNLYLSLMFFRPHLMNPSRRTRLVVFGPRRSRREPEKERVAGQREAGFLCESVRVRVCVCVCVCVCVTVGPRPVAVSAAPPLVNLPIGFRLTQEQNLSMTDPPRRAAQRVLFKCYN